MSHPTYVISLSPRAKWYVLIWFEYLIRLTCLKIQIKFLKNQKYVCLNEKTYDKN